MLINVLQRLLKETMKIFIKDDRGGKNKDSFYDAYPELEIEEKAFVINGCNQKTAEFTAAHLAMFLDEKFYQLTGETKEDSNSLIISERSCRLDMRTWRAKFEKNSNRPFFEGHERSDVVAHRSDFVNYFLSRKNYYYSVPEGNESVWQLPTHQPPVILFCK